jgi:hypothetical protein
MLKPKKGMVDPNDVVLSEHGEAADSIKRYHQAMAGLTGRDGIRDDPSRYEAVALTLVDAIGEMSAEIVDSYPGRDSPLLLEDFFKKIYDEYDLRFVYQAPALAPRTRRLVWDASSPVFQDPRLAEFTPRVQG